MLRILLLLLTLTLLPLPVGAEDAPLAFADDLTGQYVWPVGSTPEEASYTYEFTYPQIAGDSLLAITINNVFEYEATDALGFECPMIGSSHDPSLGQMQVALEYTVTHLSAEYLSVRIDKEVRVGDTATHTVKAFTFMLTGDSAGTVTSLPYLLGLVEASENDEWLLDRQTAKTETTAREMVWAMIEEAMAEDGSPIWSDTTFETLEWVFYPEEDFYLDEDGRLVFFLQENTIAPSEAGEFFYPISMDDMLDEL